MATLHLDRQPIIEIDGLRVETIYYDAMGAPSNVFAIKFDRPRTVISSRNGIMSARALFICHISDVLGLYMHNQSKNHFYFYEKLLHDILNEYGVPFEQTAFLSTGIPMKNLAWAIERYQELWVACFTTAGVRHNAIRIGRDQAVGIERDGQFQPFGTICHVMVTNASLDPGALVSSIITVTEAKNVALQELDIRSSNHPEWLATGTGTDQAIVAAGFGEKSQYVQGHTKVGEMMALSVIRSTKEAIETSIKNSKEAR
jgi:adenosylcobinamide hydrolase